MPKFRFHATNSDGTPYTGELVAGSRLEALRQIQERGQTPINIDEIPALGQWQRKVRRGSLGTCFSGIADLLESGMPLLRALEVVSTQSVHPTLRSSLTELQTGVADGLSLANAMRQQPHLFDELTVNMVRVGEEGGFLESTLRRIANLIDRQEELKSRMLSALAYPAFLGVTGIIVGAGMLLYFVPLFEPLFERMREVGELPLATIILLDVSGSLQSYWPFVGIGILCGLWFLRQWLMTASGKLRWDRWRLEVKGVGPVLIDLTLSRFCHLLGSLLASGVPILRALELAEKTVGNQVIAQAVRNAAQTVAAGGPLSEPLANTGVIPLDVTEMIAVGEQANRLENVLLNLADKLDRRAQRKLDLFTKLVEPALMTALAAMIGFLLLALLLPVFTSSSRFS